MSKRLAGLIVALTLVVFAAPASTSAAALTQVQIDAVISLLRSFDVDESIITSVNDSLGGEALATTSSSCADITATLTLGSTGGHVTNLQNYLINKGYLAAGYNTGYYGFLTAAAVGKLQLALGLVSSTSDTAYGIFGPKTRAAIACDATLSYSATIDSSSLTTSSNNPTITGTAKNTSYLSVSVYGYNGEKSAYNSGLTVSVVNGKWSTKPLSYLPFGTYTVKVFDTAKGDLLTSGTLVVSSTSIKSPTCTLDVTTSRGLTKTGLTGTGYYDGSGSTYVEINEGGWVTIKWHSTYADYAIGPGGDRYLANDSETFYPGGQKAYEWTFYGSGGTTKCGVMVEIIPAKTASATIDSSSLTTVKSGPTTITGSATNAKNLYVFIPANTYTGSMSYTSVLAAATGDSSTQSAIIAYPNPSVVSDGTWSAYFGGSFEHTSYRVWVYDADTKKFLTSGTLTITSTSIPAQTNPVVINSFTASPASVTPGQAVLFTWSSNLTSTDISYNGGGCNIEGITTNNVALNVTAGFTDASGSVTYVPPATATYTLRCYSGGKDGSPYASSKLTITVVAPSCSMTVAPYGSGYSVTWTSKNTVTAHLAPIPGMGGGWANVALNNTNPAAWVGENTTYTLTVWDKYGNQASCADGGKG